MWYRGGNNNNTGGRFSAPIFPHKHKHKNKKIKHFDSPITEPLEDLIDSNTDLKAPPNVVENPDLPAGVTVRNDNLIESPNVEQKHLNDEKPKELEELYGPDKNISDDSVQNDTRNIPLDLEQDISDIFLQQDEENEEIETPEEQFDDSSPEDDILDEVEDDIDKDLEEITESPQPVPNPPIHAGCHCEIITMPGGRKIWRASSNACDNCLNARDLFNQWQQSIYGS